LIRYAIDGELCRACGVCAKLCPHQAISVTDLEGEKSYVITSERCRKCGACREACAFGAIKVTQEQPCLST
jgi:formate hydrogenlyase subunit 6/NADH:ubiquinone oxidoreductase subunit I